MSADLPPPYSPSEANDAGEGSSSGAQRDANPYSLPEYSFKSTDGDSLEDDTDISDTPTTTELVIEEQNKSIHLEDAWEGDRCRLLTKNGTIGIHNSLKAKSIEVQTSNGSIHLEGPILASTRVLAKTNNGRIEVAQLVSDGHCELRSMNGKIEAQNLQARHLDVATNNGTITLEEVTGVQSVMVESLNAKIDMRVISVTPHTQLKIKSINGHITLHMPITYDGRFSVRTSNAEVTVLPHKMITFETDRKNEKVGVRGDGVGSSNLTVDTTNAKIDVFFDV
ncbi:uncharacterized protein BYT42DRAFT_259483 [Radiomyces spectabilis]|uniref:uncharacterized protein n=1 Tax=Radiomyces spectabilis TaxID=64574 RepID=UPI00221F5651|nr:uncharacterized protein BYT42DRAFT_259483 [Radiomyces spectabilis]KAI8384399.1 hypothetical protein BYT42DRAFT_259483 [Radiomyces spectabilis]